MPLLSQEDIAARIALYQALSDAIKKYTLVEASLPEDVPPELRVTITEEGDEAPRLTSVVRRSWPALRAAVLRDAKKELDDAEEAVRKFEAGEEVGDANVD